MILDGAKKTAENVKAATVAVVEGAKAYEAEHNGSPLNLYMV